MRVLWQEERRRFLGALDRVDRHRERRRAEMLVLYDTGCRVSELYGLDLTDYDRQRSSILVRNVKAKGQPKREVPLHPRTVRAVNSWLRIRPHNDEPALFTSQKGYRLSVRQIQADYELVCSLANIPATGVHTLRHTAATRLLDDRILPVHQVSRRLGHRSTTTTYRFYVHASTEVEARAIQKSRL